MKIAKISLAVFALSTLTACDWLQKLDFKKERGDGQYQSAMADYAAGRIDAAIKGFNKALKGDPGNASARFQLASLLQDSRSDYLGAIVEYREYLRQEPTSDKAALAKERLAICERLFSQEIARTTSENRIFVKEVEEARLETERKAAEITKLNDALSKAKDRIAILEKQLANQQRFMRDLRSEDEGSGRTVAKVTDDVRALLDEEDSVDDRLDLKKDTSKLVAEAEREEAQRGSSLLPVKSAPSADGKAAKGNRDTLFGGKKKTAAVPLEHPDTYVVQEGDTLYKIALRFYNRASAWREIREANKAVISTDGRIKAGQTIKLP